MPFWELQKPCLYPQILQICSSGDMDIASAEYIYCYLKLRSSTGPLTYYTMGEILDRLAVSSSSLQITLSTACKLSKLNSVTNLAILTPFFLWVL